MSERLRSVVEQLDIRPDDLVLEIGCGHGVAATFVCERLQERHLTAIDRSAKMIQAATHRNAAYVEAGRAEFLVSILENLDLGDRRFDKIFAVRVGLFHRDPERARDIVERWLTPGGALFAFFDQPPAPGAAQRPNRVPAAGLDRRTRQTGGKGMMRKRVLFVHGGGQGAYEEDRKMAANLRDALGTAYDLRYLKMPNQESPVYEAWRVQIAKELVALDGEVILVGHSLGASILLKYLSEEKVEKPGAGLLLIAPPHWGAEDWEVDEYELQADFASKLPEERPMFFTTATTTKWCRSRTSHNTQRYSRRRLSTSSMVADIGSATTYPKSLGTSKGCKEKLVEKVRSKDGTTIAFDRLADGPPVIVVGGQLCDRVLTRPTAEELATRFTVFNYDRRGRGDSGDTTPYAVKREIEDIVALTDEAGGRRRCTAISPVRASLCTQRRTACPSPSSFCTSRPTYPTLRRSDGTRRRSARGLSFSWQRTAAATLSSWP